MAVYCDYLNKQFPGSLDPGSLTYPTDSDHITQVLTVPPAEPAFQIYGSQLLIAAPFETSQETLRPGYPNVVIQLGASATHSVEHDQKYFVLDASFSDTVLQPDFGNIEARFALEERAVVEAFLGRDADIVSFILQAHEALVQIFPNNSMSLELVQDPNEPQGSELLILIQVKEPPAEALTKLEEFDSGWWNEHRYRAERKVTVDLKFE